MADSIDELIASLRFCSLVDVQYSKKTSKANSNKTSACDDCYKITANIVTEDAKIQDAVNMSCKFAICTTDVNLSWTAEELHQIYERQSLANEIWQIANDPRHRVDPIYLEKPKRISALIWIFSMAIILVRGFENYAKKQLQSCKIRIPSPDGSSRSCPVTYACLNRFFYNKHFTIIEFNGKFGFTADSISLLKILEALGPNWTKYENSKEIVERLTKEK